MSFSVQAGESITINEITYTLAQHPSAPDIPYGQEGRQGIVYQLISGSECFALKVFKPRFRLPSLVAHARLVSPLAELPGLQTCKRTVLSPNRQPGLLKQYPDLVFAILMPWMEGPTWQEFMLKKHDLSPTHCLSMARALTSTLLELEEQGVAHCDLSAPNLILTSVDPDTSSIALVDVEGLYAPGLPKPETLPAGSPGYAHRTASQGLWSQYADRFAGAVLLCELLSWCDPEIRDAADGESFFNPVEMQQPGGRFDLLQKKLLDRWGSGIVNLLNRAWQSNELVECPTFGEWLIALPESVPFPLTINIHSSKQPESPPSISPEISNLLNCANSNMQAGNQVACGIYQEVQELLDQARQASQNPSPTDGSAAAPLQTCLTCGKTIPAGMLVCPYCEGLRRATPTPLKPIIGKRALIFGILTIVLVFIFAILVGMQGRGLLSKLASHTSTLTPTVSAPFPPGMVETAAFATITARAAQPNAATATPNILLITPTALPLPPTTAPSATVAPTPTLAPGATQVSEKDGMVMVYVPAGEFLMGSTDVDHEVYSDQKPQHEVYLSAFWIDQTEVTNAMYQKCVKDRKCDYRGAVGGDNYPQINVNWFHAKSYCEWAGRDLPSEAEWEKAARGTRGQLFTWGDQASLLNIGIVTEVKYSKKDVSPYGVYDMAGNVREWLEDWYEKTYYNSQATWFDPTGPANGNFRVIRSGNGHFGSKLLLAAYRSYGEPYMSNGFIGFRCAR